MTIVFLLILVCALLFALRRLAAPPGVAMLIDFLFMLLFLIIIRGITL